MPVLGRDRALDAVGRHTDHTADPFAVKEDSELEFTCNLKACVQIVVLVVVSDLILLVIVL